MMALDLLVGSGGVLSHAPRRVQAMLMMIDAFLPEGVTELAVDSIFMMPHLGVLSTVQRAGGRAGVRARLHRVPRARVVAPVGAQKSGPVVRVEMRLPDGTAVREELSGGELRLWPCGVDQLADATITPLQHVDLGAGPGKPVETKLKGGVCGIVVDTRGRPLAMPADAATRVPLLQKWVQALGEYAG